jgi:hypothetical protein
MAEGCSVRRHHFVKQEGTYVVVALVIAILGPFVTTKEEVQRCTLDLGDRMEAPQCGDDADTLRVILILLSVAATW